jgi:thiol:disulfide interchange protein
LKPRRAVTVTLPFHQRRRRAGQRALLAPALGTALTVSTGESFVIFTAIAVGLSAPYLLLSIFAQAVKAHVWCILTREPSFGEVLYALRKK